MVVWSCLYTFVENKQMDHLLNLRAIFKRMKDKPKSQRLYNFFWGASKHLEPEQIKDIKKILLADHKKVISFLDKAMAEKRKTK